MATPKPRLNRADWNFAAGERKSTSPRGPEDLLALVLAGGRGTRLHPLTQGRAKAAVPFGGSFRLIDFVLSNLFNSGVQAIGVVTQFENAPLLNHLHASWRAPSSRPNEALVTALPGEVHRGELWYRGTADAVHRNRSFISSQARDVAVFGADHVYRMDVSQMLDWHRSRKAAATICALPVPVEEARRFGTIQVDDDWRIVDFREKAPNPPGIPGRPGWALASMGNYIFDAQALMAELQADAEDPESAHDFGHNILPSMVREYPIYAYDFQSNKVPGGPMTMSGYWRDVGTIAAYYEASMEALPDSPFSGFSNARWPMRIVPEQKSTQEAASNSLLAQGCRIGQASVVNSVIGGDVKIGAGADIRESIILDGCEIGPGVKIRRAIVDEGMRLPAGYELGGDRLHYLGESGITTIGKPLGAVQLAAA